MGPPDRTKSCTRESGKNALRPGSPLTSLSHLFSCGSSMDCALAPLTCGKGVQRSVTDLRWSPDPTLSMGLLISTEIWVQLYLDRQRVGARMRIANGFSRSHSLGERPLLFCIRTVPCLSNLAIPSQASLTLTSVSDETATPLYLEPVRPQGRRQFLLLLCIVRIDPAH